MKGSSGCVNAALKAEESAMPDKRRWSKRNCNMRFHKAPIFSPPWYRHTHHTLNRHSKSCFSIVYVDSLLNKIKRSLVSDALWVKHICDINKPWIFSCLPSAPSKSGKKANLWNVFEAKAGDLSVQYLKGLYASSISRFELFRCSCSSEWSELEPMMSLKPGTSVHTLKVALTQTFGLSSSQASLIF